MPREKQVIIPYKGMNRDISPGKFPAEHYFSGKNIRVSAVDGNTLMTITNEKGNVEVPVVVSGPGGFSSIRGTCIGFQEIGKYLVLFVHDGDRTRVWRLEKDPSDAGVLLAFNILDKPLGHDGSTILETMGVHESEEVVKIYFTDGKGQLSFINIADVDGTPPYSGDDGTNHAVLSPSMRLQEEVTVTRNASGGLFSAGTIQYAFSYWNLHGQESWLFAITGIQYNTFGNRAGAPDEYCPNSYTITINNLDANDNGEVPWDYLRVYSIERTTRDTVTGSRVVADIKVKGRSRTDPVIFTDTGLTTGSAFDVEALTFIGADVFSVGTFSTKDNTLFVGNLTTRDDRAIEAIQQELIDDPLEFVSQQVFLPLPLDGRVVKHWKLGETYRVGIQGQYSNGEWTSPIWTGKDVLVDKGYEVTTAGVNTPGRLYYTELALDGLWGMEDTPAKARYKALIMQLKELGIKRVRPVHVPLTYLTRSVLSQGVVLNTLGNVGARSRGGSYAYADWLARGNKDFVFGTTTETYGFVEPDNDGDYSYNLTPTINIPYMPLNFSISNEDRGMVVYGTYIPNTVSWLQYLVLNPSKFPFLQYFGAFNALRSYCLSGDSNVIVTNREWYAETFGKAGPPCLGGTSNFIISPFGKIENGSNLPTYDNYSEDASGNDINFNETTLSNAYFIEPAVMSFYSPETIYEEFSRDTCRMATSLRLRGIANVNRSSLYSRHLLSNGKAFDYNNNAANTPGQAPSDQTGNDDYDRHANAHLRVNSILTTYDNYWFDHGDHQQHVTWGLFGPQDVRRTSPVSDFTYRAQSLYSASDFCTMVKGSDPLSLNISTPTYCLTEDSSVMITGPLPSQGLVMYTPNPDEVMRDTNNFTWNITFKSPGHLVFTNRRVIDERYTSGMPVLGFRSYVPYQGAGIVNLLEYGGNIYMYMPDMPDLSWHVVNVKGAGDVLSRDPSRCDLYTGDADGQDMLNFGLKWGEGNPWEKSGLPYYWIADLVQEVTNKYGADTSLSTLRQHKWIPCGASVYIGDMTPDSPVFAINSPVFTDGDTYIQRFDFLKSFPRGTSNSDQWSRWTQGVSVWIESFVNLSGRHDKWLSQQDLTPFTYDSWGKINRAYTQPDNFLEYQIPDYDLLKTRKMPSCLAWSMQKTNNEFIDSYTRFRLLTNTYSVDGTRGPVNRIVNVNNELVGFQDSGIFNILFNARVQVPASDGVPIEIAQSYKFEGVRYLSNTIGTTNKWSVGLSNNAVYFIDELHRDICMLGSPVTNLSLSAGMSTWSDAHLSGTGTYELKAGEDRFFTAIDKTRDLVYFINDKHALCFNEGLRFFEGFYSLEDHPFMFNYLGEFYSVDQGDSGNPVVTLYKHHSGHDACFYGRYEPSSITFILNPSPLSDKTWDTIEYRGNRFTDTGAVIPSSTVDRVMAWNDYQHANVSLDFLAGNIPGLMPRLTFLGHHKFQAWSFPFPRQEGTLNRFRSPWLYLELVYNNTIDNSTMQMQDLTIGYTT